MINHQKTKNSWEFVFLWANIDVIATAERFVERYKIKHLG
jgi:hypothetical protein